jgi:hypothetical protein
MRACSVGVNGPFPFMTLLMTLSWRSLLILLVAERTMYDRS